jgi:subtilase family serine protease
VGTRKSIRYLTTILGVSAMASLAAIPLAGVAAGTTAAAATTATAHTARAVPAVLGYNGKPLYTKTSKPNAAGLFTCQAPESATNTVPCFGPSQIRTAYDVPRNLTGSGKTIAIIDAFGDPYIASDLALFDSTFGLPAAHLNIICVASATATGPCPTFSLSNADEVDWAGEIALDTQYSHAIAPGATIDLVISKSDQDADILAAQQYTINHDLGDVLSQSFGENELCLQAETSIFNATVTAFQTAQANKISVFASSGDQGSATLNCAGTSYVEGVNMPASDPLVTSVGGTHLNANYVTGQYESESVWNDSGLNPDFGAGGGGFSSIFSRPSYQTGTGSASRGVPDVTYSADVYNGVLVVFSAGNGGTPAFFIFGGTSAGSPQWAAIASLADQAAGHDLGFLNPALYNLAGSPAFYPSIFHDITVGNNAWDVSGEPGYSAHRGWDAASGLGSPIANSLILFLSRS